MATSAGTGSGKSEEDVPEALRGLYHFVRTHLAIANGIVLASCTLLGVLDFLGPRLAPAAIWVYSATAVLVALLLLGAIFPAVLGSFLSAPKPGDRPLWKRPAWQAAVLVLLIVTGVGFTSVAYAQDGGLIASHFSSARKLQTRLLSIEQDVAAVRFGVDSANVKLDKVVAAMDPDNAAERCTDLMCAVAGGASSETVRRLFAKGAKVPGEPIGDSVLLMYAVGSGGPGRLRTIDLLFQHGIDRHMLFHPSVQRPDALTREAVRWARDVQELSRVSKIMPRGFNPGGNADVGAWNDVMGCFRRDSGGVSLLEYAALRGDADLFAHLVAGGSRLPARPLACAPKSLAFGNGYARVLIDPAKGKVLGVTDTRG